MMITLPRQSFANQASILPAATHMFGIRQLAETRLQSSGYAPVRTVSCDYHDGVLTLRGSLPSYYLKQVAQALMDGLDGVLEIANRVYVVRPEVKRYASIA